KRQQQYLDNFIPKTTKLQCTFLNFFTALPPLLPPSLSPITTSFTVEEHDEMACRQEWFSSVGSGRVNSWGRRGGQQARTHKRRVNLTFLS
ncbi:hypothetical protein KUCAC02_023858, partial [Chaenocephalus aceratus]